MLKLLSGIIFGLLSAGLGVYFAMLQITTAAQGSSPILLGLSVVFIGVGLFCFIKGFLSFRAEKALATADALLLTPTDGNNQKTESGILKKNEQMLKEWNKTNDARDKLKILEVAGAAEEGS